MAPASKLVTEAVNIALASLDLDDCKILEQLGGYPDSESRFCVPAYAFIVALKSTLAGLLAALPESTWAGATSAQRRAAQSSSLASVSGVICKLLGDRAGIADFRLNGKIKKPSEAFDSVDRLTTLQAQAVETIKAPLGRKVRT